MDFIYLHDKFIEWDIKINLKGKFEANRRILKRIYKRKRNL